MTIRQIVKYPDQVLREKAAPVANFDAPLRALATDLLDTLRSVKGLGITAPHIGVLQRVVVLELPDAPEPQTYINPEIIWISDNTARHEEGSISMPGVSEQVERPAQLHVRYQDLDGETHIEAADGFRAACHQHELDQLNGTFWIQKLSNLRRNRLIARYEKLQRNRN